MNLTSNTQTEKHKKNHNVLISTLIPLGSNYGGLIQAYALQKIIRDMGFPVSTINSQRRLSTPRFILRRLRYGYRKLTKKTLGPYPTTRKQDSVIQKLPCHFISEELNTLDLFGLSPAKRKTVLSKTKVIVVGSDQVWRGGYANVKDQLLRYAFNYPIVKISYAASFGGDQPIGFRPKLVKESATLAKEFNAISVRENSGIAICRNLWDVEATQHVDPTLLLDREDYQNIIDSSIDFIKEDRGGIFAHILDNNQVTNAVAVRLSAELGLPVKKILPIQPKSGREIKQKPSDFQMKSVAEGLYNFSNADFILTDSFHGTVFSIIFNKPFLVIGNNHRGLSRFTSLLSLINLESKLINSNAVPDVLDLATPDWEEVNSKLAEERQRSFDYLRKHLTSTLES